MVRQPAAAPASTSRHRSPTMKLRARSAPCRAAPSRIRPGSGLRHAQPVGVVVKAAQKIVYGQLLAEPPVNCLDRLGGLLAARHVGLIGDDDQRQSQHRSGAPSAAGGVGDDPDFARRVRRIRFAVAHHGLVQHAIAIQEDGAVQRDRFPFGLRLLHRGVRDQQVPDHRLERLGMRRGVRRH